MGISLPGRRFGVTAIGFGLGIAFLAGWQLLEAGQLQLAPAADRGLSVQPAFEGSFKNEDGTFSLSFGYFNRNQKEDLDIPVGPNNRLDPGGPDLGQPTHFESQRHWGVFTVTVPKDFGTKEIVWTLVNRGQTLSVPGNLKNQWAIDALGPDADSNFPPVMKFDPPDPASPKGVGPRGVWAPAQTVKFPGPATISLSATDDGVESRAGTPPPRRPDQKPNPKIGLAWVKHRGPGTVTFSEPKPTFEVLALDVKTTTTATFSDPGEYVLRAHVWDTTGEDGSNQCCWTNGFVRVTVTK